MASILRVTDRPGRDTVWLTSVTFGILILLSTADSGGPIPSKQLQATRDTLELQAAMIDGSLIHPGASTFRAYVLPCVYNQRRTPRHFGVLREDVQIVQRGESTLLMLVRRIPLLAGAYLVDSSLYVRQTLVPIWYRAHSESLSVGIVVVADSARWYVDRKGLRRQHGVAALHEKGFFVASDALLVRALRDPGALGGNVARLSFVDMPGPETDTQFQGFMLASRSDSQSVGGLRHRGGWAIELGSGADNTFLVDQRTHELLAWERAETEGACSLRYIRSPLPQLPPNR